MNSVTPNPTPQLVRLDRFSNIFAPTGLTVKAKGAMALWNKRKMICAPTGHTEVDTT